jgi:hypothetical protein
MPPELRSEITCPHCGHRKLEEMPTDACQFFYECEGCGTLMRPKVGDCCVFCSYGAIPCPWSRLNVNVAVRDAAVVV